MPTRNDYLVPTTELQAVNIALEAISQLPVASLSAADVNPDADSALKRLYETNREVQGEGWHFNQEFDRVLDPTEAGEVLLPTNVLKVERVYFSGLGNDSKDLVVRGKRLYDRRGSGFKIGGPVQVDVTVLIPFEDLPEAARWYIAVKAARRFASGKLHSGNAYKLTRADEDEARIRLEQAESQTDQRTMRDNPHINYVRGRYVPGR
jgi:hypothetical protein